MNIFSMPQVLRAFNPAHAVELLVSPYNKLGFMILGSVFLAATGAEALYSDMGHVGRESIYISWPLVKICLILNYLGQGAWLLSSRGDAALASLESLNPFFLMLPGALRPVAVILSALAAVIASQALITRSYTLVSEAIRLDLMPVSRRDQGSNLHRHGQQDPLGGLHVHRAAVPLKRAWSRPMALPSR